MKRPQMLGKKREERGRGWYLCCVLLVLVLLFLWGKIYVLTHYALVQVQGPSMLDTLYGGAETGPHTYTGGDLLYVRRTAEAARGDIVILDVSDEDAFTDDMIIKRLIATEGDSIYAEDNVVYLKKAGETEWQALDEPYVKPYYTDPAYRNSFEEVTLGEGEIFVMGDNRQISADSRSLSVQLSKSDIFGVMPAWNLDPAKESGNLEAFFVRFFLEGRL